MSSVYLLVVSPVITEYTAGVRTSAGICTSKNRLKAYSNNSPERWQPHNQDRDGRVYNQPFPKPNMYKEINRR
jgi:hypothetical protein